MYFGFDPPTTRDLLKFLFLLLHYADPSCWMMGVVPTLQFLRFCCSKKLQCPLINSVIYF